MTEELQTPAQAEPNETEIQTMPPEFYGGVKKALPKPLAGSLAPRRPLVAQVRQAPSPANTTPPHVGGSHGETGEKRVSPKIVIAILGGIFVLVIAGITYYYIRQAQNIKQSTQGPAQPVTTQTENAPSAATSTPETTPAVSSTSTAPALQPLSGVIFPYKTYSQTVDSDSDGLTDAEEALFGTDPKKPDSDGDGFLDGLEVVNLYNPLGFKPVRLIDSGRVRSYLNPSLGYSIYYPGLWTAQSLDSTNEQVMFSSGVGDYVEVMKIDNPLKLSLADWYKGQSPSTQISDLKNIATKEKVEGVLSPDGLTAYLPFDNTIYVITYNIGLKDQVDFLQTFMMMVNSFRYPGVAEQSALSTPSGVEPVSTSTPSGTITP